MSRRHIAIDWKMVLGFGGLLFLMVAIGLVGIAQIQESSKVVGRLAKSEMPLQNSVLEMKSSNSKYAMGIRNYMYWRSAKYLDAAAVSEKLNLVRSASLEFDKDLDFYGGQRVSQQQKEWIQAVRLNEARLRQIGDNIVALSNKMEEADLSARKALEAAINKQLMDFESRLFQIDSFLSDPIQKSNRQNIDTQLTIAEAGRRRSIILLGCSIFVGLILGGQTAFLIYLRSKREKERRELLTRRVIKIEEEERNNLSLQIHDQMGQDLSALKIYLGLIERDLPSQRLEEKAKIEKAKTILDALMEKAHNISELLRPPELDDLGLTESIAALIIHYKEMTGCAYQFRKPGNELKLSLESSLTLYRIAQEALTNSAKYSGAKNVDIMLEKNDDNIILAISDDGAGFDYNEYMQRPSRRREDRIKLGIRGLRERIELLGGQLSVRTQQGQGTSIKVILPSSL